ncbi:MAG: hypothetical protein HY261_10930, partial [Chloroflexi bacterium]|nr:hypothetical protein [Chloroflexota bacterium]
ARGLEPGSNGSVALVFLALALLPVLFVRSGHRWLKIVALVVAMPLAFIVTAYSIPGTTWLPALILLSIISVLFLLTPLVLDYTVGKHSSRARTAHGLWTENALREG